jgi:hypothetical protein
MKKMPRWEKAEYTDRVRDGTMFTAGIDFVDTEKNGMRKEAPFDKSHYNKIEIHDENREKAETLRDRIFDAILDKGINI